MKRSARSAAVLATLLAGSAAHAGDFELPNYNAYDDAKVVSPRPVPASQLVREAVGGVSGMDEKRNVPSFFWAPKTGVIAPAAASGKAEDAARFYLDHYASQYGADRSAVASAKVRVVNNFGGRGGVTVVFRQWVAGVEILRNDVKVVMTKNLELVAIGGSLHGALSTGAKRGNTWKLAPEAAIARAVNDFFAISSSPSDFVDAKKTKDGYKYFEFAGTPESVAAGYDLE